jgi:thioredoxin reductase (NADPH)
MMVVRGTIARVTHHVIVIGSGPAGYTAAIYAARAGLAPLILASSVEVGGNLVNTTEVENFPGFPGGILGPDLMEKMREQAESFGATMVYDDAVALDVTGPIKQVTTGGGDVLTSTALIIATGSNYRRLGLADEARLIGHGVSYCATCDAAFFRGKRVMVVGGGDSAVGEATFLARFADQVTVVHRRDKLRASHAVVQRALAEPKVRYAWNSVITAIQGETVVTGVEVTDTITGETRQDAVDGIFVAIGHTPRSQMVEGQVELDAGGYIVVEGATSRTSVPGVFACGDVVDHTYRQAIVAAGSGAKAALDAQDYLDGLGAESVIAASSM